ncbi:hypothetical protein FHX81_2653 [Saccharothrix saharensis]|uniref:Uncharacterized protein n=1 Tax=Saccharothrix saharensis TaxID=571190 RepID=A0A543JBU4_9PSEU|nr:hypothetical protein [Saccharothrix saharensis]TQM80325.1 hypothetical protein FHX81_2653 [Saccharothrix saharensis]
MPATCQVRVLRRFTVTVDGGPVPGDVWRNVAGPARGGGRVAGTGAAGGGSAANGLVAFGRRHPAEAARPARQARVPALDADLGHELDEASTLLALASRAGSAARADLAEALPPACPSRIPSHLVVRVHGVRVPAADACLTGP